MVRNKPPQGNQVCVSCGIDKKLADFYASKSKLFASTERVPICKKCIEKNSKNDNGDIDLEKFKSVLRQVDKPFLASTYQSACDEAAISQREGVGRTNILGIYWKNIQSLPQCSSLTYDDSEDYNKKFPPNHYATAKIENGATTIANTKIYQLELDNKPDETLRYSHKWMGNYTETDLEYLNSYYIGLDRDYKIVTENHKDYARKISKASLHMDKCFEDMMAGVSGADKRYKDAKDAFDSLCKSAKFSESTRSLNDVGLSSFSVISERVENHNWIYEHVPIEKDEIDIMIDYLSTISKSV